ncbi:MAG: hypothetical protein ABI441_17560 [Flavobacterium sp.]
MTKKNKKIGELLGIQNEEMATLLLITVSQWSMYVLGERSLPIGVELKVAKMIAFVDRLNKEDKIRLIPFKQTIDKKNNFWEEQMIVNQRKQAPMAVNLEKCKAKYKKGYIAWHLIDFLEAQEEERPKWQEEHLQHIKDRAEAAMQKNNPELQEQYEFKLQVLQYEELLLRNKLLN